MKCFNVRTHVWEERHCWDHWGKCLQCGAWLPGISREQQQEREEWIAYQRQSREREHIGGTDPD